VATKAATARMIDQECLGFGAEISVLAEISFHLIFFFGDQGPML
jgi:hypothetical protein